MSAALAPSFGGLSALVALGGGLSVLIAATVLSRRDGGHYSAALVYLGLGAGVAVLLREQNVGWFDPLAHPDLVQHVTGAAIVIALFATGIKVDREVTWGGWSSVGRLLLWAMPLVIAGATGLSTILLGVPVGVAIMIGAMLAPTDPVLAGEIGVGPPGEGREREERFAVTGEAGLNDGLALVFVSLGLAYLGGADHGLLRWLLVDVLYSLAAAVAVGIVVGRGAGWLAVRQRDRHVLAPEVDPFVGIGAAFVLYGGAGAIGANGFVAVFIGALAFRRYERRHELNRGIFEGLERIERLAELVLIVLLGTVLSLAGLRMIGWSGWLVILSVLVVLRPASVFVSFAGSARNAAERAFLAWFGVRGACLHLLRGSDRRLRRRRRRGSGSDLVDRSGDGRPLHCRPWPDRDSGHQATEATHTPRSSRTS